MKIPLLLFTALIFSANRCPIENQEEKKLVVKQIEHEDGATLKEVSRLLEEHRELHSIAVLNWDAFSYAPEVKFRIAHGNNEIWLKYYVTEETILAKRTATNSAVSRDSCLEFFFDPTDDGNYYNFEFNGIGTPHLAHGPARQNRRFVDPDLIAEHLKIKSSLGDRPFNEKTGGHIWEMTVVIPAELLTGDEGITLAKITSRTNFYKCGDDTSPKHYVTWNPVGTGKPDYRKPSISERWSSNKERLKSLNYEVARESIRNSCIDGSVKIKTI